MPAPRAAEAGSVSIPELSRILYAWAQHQFIPARPADVANWGARTAALTTSFPRPNLGIDTAWMLGLVEFDRAGRLRPCGWLAKARRTIQSPEQLPRELAVKTFERLMAHAACGDSIVAALAHVEAEPDRLSIGMRQLSRVGENPAWSWLQQLGLAVVRNDVIVFDERLRPFVALAPAQRERVMSAAELEIRVAEQSKRAALAEEYVLRSERARLVRGGRQDLADEVHRMSLIDVSAGYDIASFDVSGNARLVEVKSSAGPRDSFFVSANELRCANSAGQSYWLAWLGWAYRLPEGPCELAWFRDPATVIAAGEVWAAETASSKVTKIEDDASAAQDP